MAWQKELVSADLLWVLLKRAGVRVEQHGKIWQWAIESPDILRQINPVEPVWHGASDTPAEALQHALCAYGAVQRTGTKRMTRLHPPRPPSATASSARQRAS
jgi:hypothetical protein